MATIDGDSNANNLFGTENADEINGWAGNDTITGNGGNDEIYGFTGDDVVDGGAGNDTIVGDFGTDLLQGGDGNDEIEGHLSSFDADSIYGGAGADRLDFGGSIQASTAGLNAVVDGGDGQDYLDLSLHFTETATVDFRLLAGGGTLAFVGLTISGVEDADAALSGAAAVVYLADFGMQIQTSNSADTVYGGFGNDKIDTGHDALADSIQAGDGDDFVLASGRDLLDGGDGIDVFSLRYDYAIIPSPSGPIDLSDFATGRLELADGTVIENFETGYIVFGSTDDQISVGAATNLYVGAGSGNDTLIGGSSGDELDGGWGDDSVSGGDGDDTVTGGSGKDDLSGKAGDDIIKGERGSDKLRGGSGADSLDGAEGRDVLIGGEGADTLRGGDHRDIFLYEDIAQVGGDVIEFLTNKDKIGLARIDADTTQGGDQAFVLISGAFSNTAGEARLSYNGTDTILELDVDGDGAADASMTIKGAHTDFTNFVL